MADRDVEVDVLARDKTGKATRTAARGFDRLKGRVQKATAQVEKATSGGDRFSKTIATVARTVGRATSTVAALASAVGPLTVGLLSTAKAVAATGRALAALGPLTAFLPSLAGSVALISGTLRLAGPGLARAVQPVVRAFFDAEGNATKLTKRIQDLASRGVQPLAAQFVKVNLPHVAAAMDQIAGATNRVVVATGRWLNSTEGQQLVQTIAFGTASAFTRLGPKVTAAAIAVGRLANRAGDKAIQGFADLIGRILDKFTAWANSTSVQDINDALSDLSGYGDRLKGAFNAIRDIGRWMGENEGKVRSFASAVAALGIAVGALSGNPFAVVIGALSLLVTNWTQAKSAFSGAADWWKSTWERIKNDPAVQAFVTAIQDHLTRLKTAVLPVFAQIKAEVGPALGELKTVIMRDVLPALTAFINAMSPIVAFLVTTFGPIVSTVFRAVVMVITGAFKIIAGIFNVITAVITGDWKRLWTGVRQIIDGTFKAIVGIVGGAVQALVRAFRGGISTVAAVAGGFKARILGAFRGAGSWLAGVGRTIIGGLVAGIRAAAGQIGAALRGVLSAAKSAVPGPLRSALGALGLSGAGTGSWRAAQFAAGGTFAAGADGRSRTGGPVQVNTQNTVNVALDGAPFYAMTVRAVAEGERRQAWRAKVGTR